jgi:hypothetical protein
MKPYPVLIRWRDAAAHDPGNWTAIPHDPGALITTVGLLVRKNRHYLTLAMSFDDNDEPLHREVFAIPRSSVVEMRELVKKP